MKICIATTTTRDCAVSIPNFEMAPRNVRFYRADISRRSTGCKVRGGVGGGMAVLLVESDSGETSGRLRDRRFRHKFEKVLAAKHPQKDRFFCHTRHSS